MGRKALNRTRINITLPADVIEEMDRLAKAGRLNRSAAIEAAIKAEIKKWRKSLPRE